MKQIMLFWRDPAGSLVQEPLDPEKIKIHTDGSFVKFNDKETGGITRIIPAHKLELVEFREITEPSRIVAPDLTPGLPKGLVS